MVNLDLPPLVTRPAFARLLGITPELLSKLAHDNKSFPKPINNTGWLRWRRADVIAYVRGKGVAHAKA